MANASTPSSVGLSSSYTLSSTMGMTPAVGSRFPRPFVFSEYLIQHPRYGLKDFLDELSSHEAHLGNELVTLVNQEYPSFIELVKGLQGVREELHPLEENCQETCAPLSDVRAQLDQYLNQLERGMARRTAIRDQRQALQRMLQVAQSIEQVESWLESLTTTVMAPHNGLPVTSTFTPSPIVRSHTDNRVSPRIGLPRVRLASPAAPTGDYVHNQHLKHLERIALESSRLLYLIKRCPNTPLIKQWSTRITQIQHTLETYLQIALDSVLEIIRDIPLDLSVARSTDALLMQQSASPSTTASLGFAKCDEPSGTLWSVPDRPSPFSVDIEALLIQCLRIYLVVDRLPLAQQQITTVLVDPVLEDALKRKTWTTPDTTADSIGESMLLHSATLSEATLDELLATFNGTLQKSVVHLWPLQDLVTRHMAGVTLDLFASAVWPVVVRNLETQWLSILNNPGVPMYFQRAYKLTLQFLDRLITLFLPVNQRQAFRQGILYREFTKQWQLSAYFTLCAKGTIDDLKQSWCGIENLQVLHGPDYCLSESVPVVAKDTLTEPVFRFTPSKALWQALRTCSDEQVYIANLAGKFWRLQTQCLHEYARWLGRLLEPLPKAITLPADGNPSPAHIRRMHNAIIQCAGPVDYWKGAQALIQDLPLTTLYSGAGCLPTPSAPRELLDTLTRLSYDIRLIVTSTANEELRSQLGRLQRDAPAADTDTLLQLAGERLAQLQYYDIATWGGMAMILVAQTYDVLIRTRQLPSYYRHTNKPMPTTASPYTADVFTSLQDFLQTHDEAILPRVVRTSIIRWVSQFTTLLYIQIIADLSDTLDRTEQSLYKLRRAKLLSTTSTQGDKDQSVRQQGVTDEAKIRTQLRLDVESFGKTLASMDGVIVSDTAWHSLHTLVMSFPQ